MVLGTRLEARVNRLNHTLYMQVGVALLGASVAIYTLVAFYRVTQGGISEVSRQLDEIAKGNLTLQPRPWGSDEVAQLMNRLAGMLESLRTIVNQVRASTSEINTASQDVASASMDLSRRTEETASQLQRTSAALAQIGATVQQTAQTAQAASSLVATNADVASKGGEEVSQAAQTMGNIRQSSARIGELIGSIDGIAFQTNILVLNAAVEAARASEQGRGFAVVTAEVRSLGQRSAEAAREIKTLIVGSVEQVEHGTQLVDDARKTMDEIVVAIRRVTYIVAEINSASAEQSTAVQQVRDAVTQMDLATQQNASLVEESAAASGTLKTQAHQLVQAVSVFRIALNQPGLVQPAAPRVAPARTFAEPRKASAPTTPAPAKRHAPVAAPEVEESEWGSF